MEFNDKTSSSCENLVLIDKRNDRRDKKSQMQGQKTVNVKMNQTC